MQLNVRRIKIAMIDKNMSNVDLAKAIGAHPATIAAWFKEPERPQLDDVNKLAKALDLADNEILANFS